MNFVLNYLSYTYKVGDLALNFTWPSVLQMDDEYRCKQAQFGFPWGVDSQHLNTKLVWREKDKDKTKGKPQNQRFRREGTQGEEVQRTCDFYNEGRVCPHNPCRYLHACAVCKKKHCRADHASASPSGEASATVTSKKAE